MYARYTPNGKNAKGRMIENAVPTSRIAFSSRKTGRTSDDAGMSIETSVRARINLRPRNLPKASPYPAGIAVTITIAVALRQYTREFSIQRQKMWPRYAFNNLHAVHTFSRFPTASGLLLRRSSSVFVGASRSHTSGTAKKTPNAPSTAARSASAARRLGLPAIKQPDRAGQPG